MAENFKEFKSISEPEDKYEVLYRTMPLGVVYQDKDGIIILCNPAAEKILGRSHDEMKGLTSDASEWKFIHEDGSVFPGESHPAITALRTGKPVNNTVMGFYHPSEQKHRWILVNATPLFKPGESSPDQVYMTFNDITELRKYENALFKTDSFLNSLIDQSPNPISITDDKGTLVRINNALLNLMNISENEVLGKYNVLKDNIIEEQGNMPLVRRVFSKGDTVNFEISYNTALLKHLSLKNRVSIILDVTIFPVKDKNGKLTNVILQQSDITEQKKIMESLLQSEDRYKHLVESTTDYIYTFNVKGNELLSTSHGPGCFSITGYTPDELNKNPDLWTNMIYPEDKKIIEAHGQRILNNEELNPIEHRIIHKDGSIRWVRNSTVVLRDSSNKPISFDSLISDITQRKNAEIALQSAKEFAENLIETANTIVVGLDLEGRIIIFNKAAEEITGYTRDEVTNKSWFDVIVPRKNFPEVLKEFERLATGGIPARFENNIRTKNEEERYIVWRNNTVTSKNRVTGTISFGMDITERKTAEEALKISEKKYRNIFERAVEGIFQSTPQGKFISINPSFAGMLGYDNCEELIADITSIKDQLFVNPDEYSKFIQSLAQEDHIDGFEHQFYRKDGTKIWVSTNAQAVRNNNGEIIHYEGISENITNRKKADEEKEKLQIQLNHAQKMEALGTFVGGIAHDFNNILSIMTGYADLMQMEIDENSPLRAYIDQIISSAEKATGLTQNLLTFSRKKIVSLDNINLNNHIQKTETLLRRLLTEDIIFKTKLTDDDTSIMGDATQIDQILFNLATNARDAITKGGNLTIETRIVEPGIDHVDIPDSGKPGKYVLMSVSDTGSGIDSETMQHMFDPFFTTKEVGKGTGLGLSTVYGIVNQHNGHINVYSEPGLGTTFHIYFPVSGHETGTEISGNRGKSIGGSEKILVAEDNNQVRLLIKTILEKYGYQIIEAIDGHDAIQKFNTSTNVDLVIIDSVMPYKNGREVYDEIIKKYPDIKVLFTSGYTRDIILDKGIKDREFDFIKKPLETNSLLSKIREILDRK
ncbi:MAG: PAS domain S-box protein [Spirochaetes bacterium]|nr:PAS domain S-box protein [Spirochaetota bacterium]